MAFLDHTNLHIVITTDFGEKYTVVEMKKNTDGSYGYRTIENQWRTDFIVFIQTVIDQQQTPAQNTFIHQSPIKSQ